ncbi:glycosyltransferase family 8 protein [Vagococcus elongatus]|uniref:Glycosyl transferase n=1 Tax=Vagococcus elongatus TaxID=180344 RepID=A0A430B5U1_9ENTE|nr:glycosyltransferase family 8 protein [Vagococcus elongatus]RSU15674.1 hypothetical protein CBF29_00955 [Vagococcus elongatus]
MNEDKIHILVTLNENYLEPLKTMLVSLVHNNFLEDIDIWLIHQSISDEKIEELKNFTSFINCGLHVIKIDEDYFTNAPVSKKYPKEMYFRLLAPVILPSYLNKIIYLDPDILVINSIRPLWELDFQEMVFAASAHTGLTDISQDINNLRLGTEHAYYNTGVIAIDLTKAKKIIKKESIFSHIEESIITSLLLPDQDIFNALYGKMTLEIPDEIWNYDTRKFSKYITRTMGTVDFPWIIKNTVILHYCGKSKPWKVNSTSRFHALHKHYQNLTDRYETAVAVKVGDVVEDKKKELPRVTLGTVFDTDQNSSTL